MIVLRYEKQWNNGRGEVINDELGRHDSFSVPKGLTIAAVYIQVGTHTWSSLKSIENYFHDMISYPNFLGSKSDVWKCL